MEKIKILVFEPFKPSYLKLIDDSLEAMEEIIGGYYEEIYLGVPDLVLVCNEEGRLKKLPHDRGFFGTFFIVGVDKGETVSIPEYRIEEAKSIFEHRGNFESKSEYLSRYFEKNTVPYKMFDYHDRQRKILIDTPSVIEFMLNLQDLDELKNMEDKVRQLEASGGDILDLLKEVGGMKAKQHG